MFPSHDHRAGTAFSQESLRYVRFNNIGMRFPNTLCEGGEKEEEARRVFEDLAKHSERAYERLENLFINDKLTMAQKKAYTSAFRRIAPIGLCTDIIITANVRAWRHIIELRTSAHAEEEVQEVIGMAADQLVSYIEACLQDMSQEDGPREFEHSKV